MVQTLLATTIGIVREKCQILCIRPLNPPILGDFEFRTPQNWGQGGPSAIIMRLTESFWDRFYMTNHNRVDLYQVLRILKHLGRVVQQ